MSIKLNQSQEITVIIPTWNRADLLVRAVRSALAQTISPLEVLVCDDGSTDDSEAVIHAMNDRRVRWLRGDRSGRPAIPRNRGIRESLGEWLAFLDNDDEWLPDKLEKQLKHVEQMGCKAVCSNALRYFPGQGFKGNYLIWDQERITFYNLLRVNRVICSSAVVHRSIIEKADGFPLDRDLKALEDSLWLRVATRSDFAFVAEPLLIYRDDAEGSIRREDADEWRQRQLVFADFSSWVARQENSEAYHRVAQRELLFARLRSCLQNVIATVKRVRRTLLK